MTNDELRELSDKLEDIMWETTDCSSYAKLKKIIEELDKKYELYS